MRRQLLLIATFISISLVGCSSTVENSVIEESLSETTESIETAAPEPTVAPEVTPTPTPTVESTATPEPTEPPITKNEDGTYTYSEEFLSSISTFDFFEGASEELVMDYLNTMAPTFIKTSKRDIQTTLAVLGRNDRLVDIWSLPSDTPDSSDSQQSTPAPDTNTTNNSSSSTTNTNTNTNTTTGGNTTTTTQTPPESSTPDEVAGSMDGMFGNMGDFGGGERIDSGAVITTP